MGAALAEKKQRILVVLSVNLGADITIYDVLLNPYSYPIDQVIITDLGNVCDLVPANIDL